MERRRGTARAAVAFVLLTLSGLATLSWSLLDQTGGALLARLSPASDAGPGAGFEARPGTSDRGGDASAAPAHALAQPATRLFVDTGGAALTLLPAPAGAPPLQVVQGGARLEGEGESGALLRLLPTEEPGPWTLVLARDAPWSLEIGGGLEQLRLELSELELSSLRLEAPAGSLEATLPRAGRSEIALGPGRSLLRLAGGSDADVRLTLGPGPLVLRAEPGARGSVELVPGLGPATLIVDAGVKVALELPPGEAPPLALEGTWWRHDAGGAVTWVRGPAASSPEAAELKLVVLAPARAPLAVTYR